jgi:hypothetical protein
VQRKKKRRQTNVRVSAFVFYRALAGFLLGEAVATGTSGWLYSVCVLGTILVCLIVDQIGRYCFHPFVISEGFSDDAECLVDHVSMQKNAFIALRSETLHDDMFTLKRGHTDMRRRYWFVGVQIVAMIFMLVSVPLRVQQSVGTLFCFGLLTLCGTAAACGGLIHVHAHFHPWIWAAFTLLWACVVVIGQVLPTVILGNTWSLFLPWVGIPAGMLYYISLYYWRSHSMDYISGREQMVGVLFFGIAVAQAPLNKYFLIA